MDWLRTGHYWLVLGFNFRTLPEHPDTDENIVCLEQLLGYYIHSIICSWLDLEMYSPRFLEWLRNRPLLATDTLIDTTAHFGIFWSQSY